MESAQHKFFFIIIIILRQVRSLQSAFYTDLMKQWPIVVSCAMWPHEIARAVQEIQLLTASMQPFHDLYWS